MRSFFEREAKSPVPRQAGDAGSESGMTDLVDISPSFTPFLDSLMA